MDNILDLLEGFSGVLITLALTLTGAWGLLKKKAKDIREAMQAIEDAVKDDKVTNEEVVNIVREFKDVLAKK